MPVIKKLKLKKPAERKLPLFLKKTLEKRSA